MYSFHDLIPIARAVARLSSGPIVSCVVLFLQMLKSFEAERSKYTTANFAGIYNAKENQLNDISLRLLIMECCLESTLNVDKRNVKYIRIIHWNLRGERLPKPMNTLLSIIGETEGKTSRWNKFARWEEWEDGEATQVAEMKAWPRQADNQVLPPYNESVSSIQWSWRAVDWT